MRLLVRIFVVPLLAIQLFAAAEQPWTPVGPYGGDAAVVAVQPRTSALLAASAGGLLFRSDDAGSHWEHVSFPGELLSMVHALLFDSAGERRYFVGVSNAQASSGGLYRTKDDGASWHLVSEFKGKQVWALAAFPADPKIIAAGASDGVYLSQDNGDHWHRISAASNLELQPVVSLVFDSSDSRILFAGTPHLPWRTTDSGATWSSIHTGMIDDSDVFSIAVAADPPQRIFASACSGMYRSENQGKLWTKLKGSANASYRTYVILPDPSTPARVFAGTTAGLQRSTDAGLTWQRILPGTVRSVALDQKTPNRLYAASTNGLMRSDDGGDTFQPIDAGFSGRNLQRLFATRAALIAGGAGATVETRDAGASWQAVGPQNIVGVASDARSIVAAEPRALWLSADAGKTWKKIAGPPLKGSYTAIGLQSNLFYVGTTAGLLSDPLAPIWKGTRTGTFDGTIEVIAVDAVHNRLIAATRSHAEAFSGGIWKPVQIPVPDAEWNGFAFDSASDSVIASTSRGIYFSPTLSGGWQLAKGSESVVPATSLMFHPEHPQIALAVQSGAALVSNDGGRSWKPLIRRGSEVSPPVRSLAAVAGQPNQIFALVAGHGVFAARIDSEPNPATNQPVRHSP